MKRLKYLAAGVLLTVSLLFIYYGKFIVNANHLNFAPWGDGYKNFYTLSYYLKNDSGVHFSGMNYPYGENVIYTDNQPLLAWILKPITKIFPAVAEHLHGILIWLIVLSFILCFFTIYHLLIEFKLPSWYSGLGAVAITMLSPQLIRMNGHFSLAYSFYLPLVTFLLVKFIHSGFSNKYPFYLSLFLSAFAFIHPYYLAISGFFLTSSALLLAITIRGSTKQKLYIFFKTLLPVVIGFAAIKGYLLITDSIEDRPTAPWGFMESSSSVRDIFSHTSSWLYSFLQQLFPNLKGSFHLEGSSYIGFATEVVLMIAIANTLYYIIKRKAFITIPFEVKIVFAASIPVLLFALAFPFCINGLAHWLDEMPSFIKQFRAAGRFSWMFYYCSTLFSVVVFYQIFLHIKNRTIAYLTLAFFFFLWFIDINMINIFNQKETQKWAVVNDEKEEWQKIEIQLKKSGYLASDFQAILPLPYFMNGCEKIYLESYANYEAMKVSNASNLPIAATMMSRTSVSQSLRLVNLLSSNLIKKDILEDLPSQKSFLLIAVGEEFSRAERDLMYRSKYLFNINNCSFFHLPFSAFNDTRDAEKENFRNSGSAFIPHGDYLSDTKENNVVVKRFEDHHNSNSLSGSGALYEKNGLLFLFNDTLPNAKDSTWYEMSWWLFTDMRIPAYPVMYFRELDTTGGEVYSSDVSGKFSTENYKNWVRVSCRFPLYHSANKVYAALEGEYKTIDEWMIRPLNVNVVTGVKGNTSFMYNNYPIE